MLKNKNMAIRAFIFSGHFVFFITVSVFLWISCKTNSPSIPRITIPNKALEAEYNTSLAKWNKLKAKHKNSYEYKISHSSWIGYRSSTIIRVRRGKVVGREFYENKMIKNKGYSEEALIYKEDEADINSHRQGDKAVLFDQHYKHCGEVNLKQDEKTNRIIFKTDEEGVISDCGHIFESCVADCFEGVHVVSLEWLK
jgi:hypothetical protein